MVFLNYLLCVPNVCFHNHAEIVFRRVQEEGREDKRVGVYLEENHVSAILIGSNLCVISNALYRHHTYRQTIG